MVIGGGGLAGDAMADDSEDAEGAGYVDGDCHDLSKGIQSWWLVNLNNRGNYVW